jgi:transcriptional regulator with XRE-family HTH domain
MAKNRLSLKLLELRQERNLTQKELCAKLNISRTNYSYFENGRRVPDVDTLLLIAEFYGVSLDELVTGTHSAVNESKEDTTAYDLGITLVRHLQSKHIPIENIMKLSKADFDFLTDYKKLTAENQAELNYLMNYKIRKQSE